MSFFGTLILRNTFSGPLVTEHRSLPPETRTIRFSEYLFILLGLSLQLASCSTQTIGQIKEADVDLKDVKIEGGLDKAMQNYQVYLDKAPVVGLKPEAILRLADLELQKDYDLQEKNADSEKAALSVRGKVERPAASGKTKQPDLASKEAINDFEQRATSSGEAGSATDLKSKPVKAGASNASSGTREAIVLYKKLLNEYPNFENNDHALYQLARIYEEMGNTEEAINMMDRLAKGYPRSRYIEEIQFRRGEHYYVRKKFATAQDAYQAIVLIGARSSYYELALYKLGWSFYKQEQYEAAMRQFVALLDHKIATGYDIDHPRDSFDEKRVEDTYRVMSLGFSYLGGGEAVAGFFKKYGRRPFEASVYKNLGDHYLEKRRYNDAAMTFQAFVKNNPDHKMAPYFGMWAIDSYKKGDFSKLVIESDKEFITNFGWNSTYWTRVKISVPPEIDGYINTTLKELANYHHAQFLDKRFVTSKDKNFQEAMKWYRELLASYPYSKDKSVPAMHYQMAELLLVNKWFGQAAIEFEYVAYDYPAHDKTAAAGYAAVYALREKLATVGQDEKVSVKRDVIRSSLKFADNFLRHEKASLVLGAAIDDLYGLKEYALAATNARKLLARYPGADSTIRRPAWLVFANSSFELGALKDAEEGYVSALGLTANNDASRANLIENLAVTLYKEAEQASKLGDYRTAATYFLLVDTNTPTAKIRPAADFDAAVALMQLKDWDAAVNVLRTFRTSYPGHALQPELTKKLALAYREAGELSLAATEYVRVAAEAKDAAVRGEALLVAGELYAQAKELDNAYPVYLRYVKEFPKPLETALEIHTKIAEYLKTRDNLKDYLNELKYIQDADVRAGPERTPRTRFLGASAALEFAEIELRKFSTIKIEEPFDKTLAQKKEAMKVAKEHLDNLFGYEVEEITSAATFYLAEMYYDFNRKLVTSERPDDLSPLEKEQYELSIEEQAFPFEEKAIQIHQKNLELMTRNIFNSWIEKSIDKLAILVPARYAKFEESIGFIDAIDNASYVALVEPKPLIMKSSPAGIAPTQRLNPVQEVPPVQKSKIESDRTNPVTTVE